MTSTYKTGGEDCKSAGLFHRGFESHRATTLGSNIDGHVRSIKIGYDDLARPLTITSYSAADGTGTVRNQVQYEYNDLGQILMEYQSHETAVNTGTTPKVEYIYDTDVEDDQDPNSPFTNDQRLIEMVYPGGRRIHYTYGSPNSISDLLHRIDAIKADSVASPGTHTEGLTLASYAFNGLGRFVEVLYDQASVSLDYKSTTPGTYSGFDRFGRIIDQKWEDSSGDIDRFQYTYDEAGNRTSRDIPATLYDSDDKDQAYTYDSLHRLMNFDRGTLSGTPTSITSPNREQDFDLDQLGNWEGFDVKTSGSPDLVQSRTHNDANEITVITETTGPSWRDATYNTVGNITSGPPPGQETGQINFTYDAWNRMVLVTNMQDHAIATYEYDGLSRRIVKTVDPDSADVDYDYYYNTAWQVLEIRKNSDTDPLKQYVWDARYIDAPAIRYYDENTDDDVVTHYYANDANMNVTALLDDTGAVVERYEYDPYGKAYVLDEDFVAVAGDASAYDNEVLYAGYRFDGESGLYHVRYRMYHPGLGRWMQRDPIGYIGGMNLYGYVGAMPLRLIDPSGLLQEYCGIGDAGTVECASVDNMFASGWFGGSGVNIWRFKYSRSYFRVINIRGENWRSRNKSRTIKTVIRTGEDTFYEYVTKIIEYEYTYLDTVRVECDGVVTYKKVETDLKEREILYIETSKWEKKYITHITNPQNKTWTNPTDYNYKWKNMNDGYRRIDWYDMPIFTGPPSPYWLETPPYSNEDF